MKHLELHILQSVPVSCLNRDDLNSPKTAIFGGVQRARVSSQSWKRAIREMAKEFAPKYFRGERTRLIVKKLLNALINNGLPEAEATKASKTIANELATLNSKSEDKVTTLYFMSPLEIETIAKKYINTGNDPKKAIKRSDQQMLKDAADISLFGRMVANDHSLTVEAASMFSHAISVHRADNEIDFFSAVDDLLPDDLAEAGMINTLEFNSALYYRFAALNLDMLFDENHLKSLTLSERKTVVRAFVESTIKAMPVARKYSMNANTLPSYVLGVIRKQGHPIQLVNAFEKPVMPSNNGYIEKAITLLNAEFLKLNEKWDIKHETKIDIPDLTINEFLTEIEKHVQ
jgi:CRISPR system Cascade subunit CasC